MSAKSTGSNNFASWAQYIFHELERLAEMEKEQSAKVSKLDIRVTRLEEKLHFQSRALACIASTAIASVAGLIMLVVKNLLF